MLLCLWFRRKGLFLEPPRDFPSLGIEPAVKEMTIASLPMVGFNRFAETIQTPSISTNKCKSALEIIDSLKFIPYEDSLKPLYIQTMPDGSKVPPTDWRHHQLRWQHLLVQGHVSMDSLSQYDQTKGSHLIVLVHGFQGWSQDMRLLAANISICFPSHQVSETTSSYICKRGVGPVIRGACLYVWWGERFHPTVSPWFVVSCPLPMYESAPIQ